MSRGRDAVTPLSIPSKGWMDVARRMWDRQSETHLELVSAGIAFYGLLSLFPGITALVAIAGLLFDPDILFENSQTLAAMLPTSAADIILNQMKDVLGADETSLGFAILLTLGLSIYSASKSVAHFITGLNIIYEESEDRSFFRLTALKVVLTLAVIISAVVVIGVAAALPAVAAYFGETMLQDVVLWVRWPVLFVVCATVIAMLFRFGPDRRAARWRWLTPGALVACVLWLLGSIGFSLYVQNFGTYNETFGALGGVIVLLTWLWLSAFVVLLGALLDAEMEAQTAKDSTIGPDRPMGQRGATKADTLGEIPGSDKAAE